MLAILKWLLSAGIVFAVLVVVARMLFPLPDRSEIQPSAAVPLSGETRWGKFLKAAADIHPGKSGVMPLATGHSALAARLMLVSRAESSVDLQYYIWHDDVSGRLLLKALYDAANRGVRVRLLVDDNGIHGMDATFMALDAMDHFEVRIFNPSRVRSPKMLGYAFDLMRMNRRMHNKALIVDGAAAILGGRNIGDEYFAIGDHNYFLDLDAIAAGPIVPETSAEFDLYWNAESVYPVNLVVGGEPPALPDWLSKPPTSGVPEWVADLPALEAHVESKMINSGLEFEWTDVKLVYDDPIKGMGKAKVDQLMINRLGAVVGDVKRSLDLVSAYFIPGKSGVEYFVGIQKSGATVEVLTNSLNATDVALVHAGYSKYRRALLEGGVTLYELKPLPGVPIGEQELSVIGSSGSSLHAKTLSIDLNRIFIGSFNFDPRSVNLNCEMGFMIDSQVMAKQMRAGFENQVRLGSYQVVLRDGKMRWIERAADGSEIVHDDEPDVSALNRFVVTVMGWLPIEWAL